MGEGGVFNGEGVWSGGGKERGVCEWGVQGEGGGGEGGVEVGGVDCAEESVGGAGDKEVAGLFDRSFSEGWTGVYADLECGDVAGGGSGEGDKVDVWEGEASFCEVVVGDKWKAAKLVYIFDRHISLWHGHIVLSIDTWPLML